MKARKISSNDMKELFKLSEEDIMPCSPDRVLAITKVGDLVTSSALSDYLNIPYSTIYNIMAELTKAGRFENLGKKTVPLKAGGQKVRSNVYRRIS